MSTATAAEYIASLTRTLARYAARLANGSDIGSDEYTLLIGQARSLAKRTDRSLEQVLIANGLACCCR